MPFCIRESEYDPAIHDIISGPSDTCSDCGTGFVTGTGSEVRLDSVHTTDEGVVVSVIFTEVVQAGVTTVSRTISTVSSPYGLSLIVGTSAVFSGPVILEFRFPASISENDFYRMNASLFGDNSSTYDTTIAYGPYAPDYESRTMYASIYDGGQFWELYEEQEDSEFVLSSFVRIMKAATEGKPKKIEVRDYPIQPGSGCTKEEPDFCRKPDDSLGTCRPACENVKYSHPKLGRSIRNKNCDCVEMGVCCEGSKRRITLDPKSSMDPGEFQYGTPGGAWPLGSVGKDCKGEWHLNGDPTGQIKPGVNKCCQPVEKDDKGNITGKAKSCEAGEVVNSVTCADCCEENENVFPCSNVMSSQYGECVGPCIENKHENIKPNSDCECICRQACPPGKKRPKNNGMEDCEECECKSAQELGCNEKQKVNADTCACECDETKLICGEGRAPDTESCSCKCNEFLPGGQTKKCRAEQYLDENSENCDCKCPTGTQDEGGRCIECFGDRKSVV